MTTPKRPIRMQPRAKLRSLKTSRRTSGFFGGEFADDEGDEGDDQEHEGPANPTCAEPVVFLTFVEDDLETSQSRWREGRSR